MLASAYGLGGMATAGAFGMGTARAALTDPAISWSYCNHTNPYWNEIVEVHTQLFGTGCMQKFRSNFQLGSGYSGNPNAYQPLRAESVTYVSDINRSPGVRTQEKMVPRGGTDRTAYVDVSEYIFDAK